MDLLIDVAASGENVVERERLVGAPPGALRPRRQWKSEEGELRPQLLDRFGLSVDVRTPDDVATRASVIRRQDAFERDEAFVQRWQKEDARLRRRIVDARARVDTVEVPDAVLERGAAAVHGARYGWAARRTHADAPHARWRRWRAMPWSAMPSYAGSRRRRCATGCAATARRHRLGRAHQTRRGWTFSA